MLQTYFDLSLQACVPSSSRIDMHSAYTQLWPHHSLVVHFICVLLKVTVLHVRYGGNSKACSHVGLRIMHCCSENLLLVLIILRRLFLKSVSGLNPGWSLSVWSLHVLSVYARVLSGYSGFLPLPEHMHFRLTGDSKLTVWVSVSVNGVFSV